MRGDRERRQIGGGGGSGGGRGGGGLRRDREKWQRGRGGGLRRDRESVRGEVPGGHTIFTGEPT